MAAKRPPRTQPAVDLAVSPIDPDAPRERPDAGLPVQQGPTLHAGDEAELVEPGNDPDDLFVSCVPEKGVVTRFGGGGGAFIGARRDAKSETGISYTPEAVVFVPGDHYRRFAREYSRVLAEGALVKRSRAQYNDWKKRRAEQLQQAKAERESARAAHAQATQEPTQPSTPVALAAAGTEAPAPPADPTSGG